MPRAFQNARKATNSANTRSKTRKMRPRHAQERQRRQHGPNMETENPTYNSVQAPPNKLMHMLMQAVNACGL